MELLYRSRMTLSAASPINGRTAWVEQPYIRMLEDVGRERVRLQATYLNIGGWELRGMESTQPVLTGLRLLTSP